MKMASHQYNDHKLVKVTSKRQFTIPKKYYDALQIGEKAKCYTDGRKLVIEPTPPDSFWDFSSEILKELIAENYSGEELLKEFDVRKKKATRAMESWSEEVKVEASEKTGTDAEVLFSELLNDNNA